MGKGKKAVEVDSPVCGGTRFGSLSQPGPTGHCGWKIGGENIPRIMDRRMANGLRVSRDLDSRLLTCLYSL